MKTLNKYLNESILDDEEDLIDNNDILIEKFLKENYIIEEDYNIHNGIVDIPNHKYRPIIVKNKNLQYLTNGLFKFGNIDHFFDCSSCKNLKSLEGAPQKCKGFICNNCKNLKSLEGAPEEIEYDFYCDSCSHLESFKGAPKKIGRRFYCSDCKNLKSIDLEGEYINFGLYISNCINLENIKKLPKKIKTFVCSNCPKLITTEEEIKKMSNIEIIKLNKK